VLVAACASAPPPAPPLDNRRPEPAVAAEPAFAITVTREITCATCPAYVVRVTSSGVTWNGIRGVRVQGAQTGPIARGQLDQLAVAIDLWKFFERNAAGAIPTDPPRPPCSAEPTVTLRIREGDKDNQVAFSPGCEGVLRSLVEQIEDAAGVAAWR
jgi:hypothetical protein